MRPVILQTASHRQLRNERNRYENRHPYVASVTPSTFRRLAAFFKCKLLAICLFAAGGFANAQIFFSDEEFYRFLENRQRMALAEAQARAWAQEWARYEEGQRREREAWARVDAANKRIDEDLREIDEERRQRQ